jgi:hypothetical protein
LLVLFYETGQRKAEYAVKTLAQVSMPLKKWIVLLITLWPAWETKQNTVG